jgi:hypothetical protein
MVIKFNLEVDPKQGPVMDQNRLIWVNKKI